MLTLKSRETFEMIVDIDCCTYLSNSAAIDIHNHSALGQQGWKMFGRPKVPRCGNQLEFWASFLPMRILAIGTFKSLI